MIPFLMERGGKETSRLPEGAVIIYPSVERLRFGVFSLEKMINPQARRLEDYMVIRILGSAAGILNVNQEVSPDAYPDIMNVHHRVIGTLPIAPITGGMPIQELEVSIDIVVPRYIDLVGCAVTEFIGSPQADLIYGCFSENFGSYEKLFIENRGGAMPLATVREIYGRAVAASHDLVRYVRDHAVDSLVSGMRRIVRADECTEGRYIPFSNSLARMLGFPEIDRLLLGEMRECLALDDEAELPDDKALGLLVRIEQLQERFVKAYPGLPFNDIYR